MEKRKRIIILISTLVVIAAIVYWVARPRLHDDSGEGLSEADTTAVEINQLYGIDYSDLTLEEGRIENGQTISTLFSKFGVGPAMIDRTDKAAASVFPLRGIRAGHKYTAFLTNDSIPRLRYFVYEDNIKDYIVISYAADSVTVSREHKEVVSTRRLRSGEIESSLWNSMVAAGMNPGMIKNFEDIYQWTIDFFGIQPGDHFTVIYDELSIDGEPVGAGMIWGAVFDHSGKEYFAIPFRQSGKVTYWDEKGNSLRKNMLKAPLTYNRISSRYSNSRMHPVYKIRRPHYGVDYAAPSGTPVVSVADGTVTFRGWDNGGGGNYIKIKHARGMETRYLHLSRFAKGLTVGKRVSQGETIGYVGSTGASTGPHLDYRVYMNGKPTDPLKITSEPAEPLSKANMADFEMVRERIMGELAGTLDESTLRITQLDSLEVYRTPPTLL
jgi:murein DD-endopeptidase MepM/ murein hydrolase activator NlpD